jgi:type IV secretion system protein VirB10
MLLLRPIAIFLLGFGMLAAQDVPPAPASANPPAEAAAPAQYPVNSGTVVPLSLINSISTRHSIPGDHVYLETAFPILSNGRIVIPVGSYVEGTVTQIKKPGRVKGRAELYVRFDSLILPNGVTRDFRARMGGMDGTAPGTVDRNEGKVTGEGNKAGDARTIGEAAGQGASAGGVIGGVSGHPGKGVGIGAAAGAAAGLIGVLVSRGPDAVLARGSNVDMVLDRQISFNESELNFGNYQPPHVSAASAGPGPNNANIPPAIRRIPK